MRIQAVHDVICLLSVGCWCRTRTTSSVYRYAASVSNVAYDNKSCIMWTATSMFSHRRARSITIWNFYPYRRIQVIALVNRRGTDISVRIFFHHCRCKSEKLTVFLSKWSIAYASEFNKRTGIAKRAHSNIILSAYICLTHMNVSASEQLIKVNLPNHE